MKIVQEFADNWVDFYLDFLLSEKFADENSEEVNPKNRALLKKILNIPGVQTVFIKRYKIAVQRSLAFDRELIAAATEKAIREVYETQS